MAFYPEQKEKGCTTKDKQIHITLESLAQGSTAKGDSTRVHIDGGPRTDHVRK